MKINNQQQYNRQFFKGSFATKAVNYLAEHPSVIATLAGSSVVAQKIAMSGTETFLGTSMDLIIGKAITKITGEKDGRTNESSKTQAIRTFAQSFGGTISGVLVRGACIAAATLAVGKIGSMAGEKLAQKINPDSKLIKSLNEMQGIITEGGIYSKEKNLFEYQEKIAAWGRNTGGALATVVMLATNFLIDVPLINSINTKTTEIVKKHREKKAQENLKQTNQVENQDKKEVK